MLYLSATPPATVTRQIRCGRTTETATLQRLKTLAKALTMELTATYVDDDSVDIDQLKASIRELSLLQNSGHDDAGLHSGSA